MAEQMDVTSFSFSSLDTDASSSPEFRSLLEEIDKKMHPISERPKVDRYRCLDMMRQISSSKGSIEKKKVQIHTGALLQGNFTTKPDVLRKLRLAPMSFLATQDLDSVKLHFWSNLSPDHEMVKEIFRPIFDGTSYANSIEISQFDPQKECAIAFPSSRRGEEGRTLCKVYEIQTDQTSLSDLMRVTVLHNYGGAWIDSDVLLIRDMSPVLEEDWAYFGQRYFVNNAVMSTTGPRSLFMKAYMSYVVGRTIVTGHCAYGPRILRYLAEDIEQQKSSRTFHVLPPCFFDGGWTGVRNATGWNAFFTEPTTQRQEDYITPRVGAGRSDDAFAYHWHGRWGSPIAQGSLAEFAEKLYTKLLKLPEPEKQKSSEEK